MPVALGVVPALTVHIGKAGTRMVAHVATIRVAAPVLSTIEDVAIVVLDACAILLLGLVLVAIAALVVGVVLVVRRAWRRRARRGERVLASSV